MADEFDRYGWLGEELRKRLGELKPSRFEFVVGDGESRLFPKRYSGEVPSHVASLLAQITALVPRCPVCDEEPHEDGAFPIVTLATDIGQRAGAGEVGEVFVVRVKFGCWFDAQCWIEEPDLRWTIKKDCIAPAATAVSRLRSQLLALRKPPQEPEGDR